MPMKFIHFTDIHQLQAGQSLHGLNPHERLQACLDSINQFHDDAEFCVITGDLAHRGEDHAYRLLLDQLDQVKMPCHLVIGNHDHRETFKNCCKHVKSDIEGFVQYTVETNSGVFVMLDTVTKPGSDLGAYCKQRQDWLQKTLIKHQNEPVFLFMHHPPFEIHIPAFDKPAFNDKNAFSEMVHSFKNIRHLFFGHTHRPIFGNWQGISFSSMRSTNHQVELNFKEPSELKFCDEKPEYAVVFLTDESVVIHSHSYL
ncbi:MAG: phosphodiesterase [SAR324 cluster bacterium]|nr:phosphodiesterase [SAR324 cluster bacterium]